MTATLATVAATDHKYSMGETFDMFTQVDRRNSCNSCCHRTNKHSTKEKFHIIEGNHTVTQHKTLSGEHTSPVHRKWQRSSCNSNCERTQNMQWKKFLHKLKNTQYSMEETFQMIGTAATTEYKIFNQENNSHLQIKWQRLLRCLHL